MTEATLSTAVGFISQTHSEADLDRLVAAINQRRRALGELRAAAVTVGVRVTVARIKPKYYNGLSGEVTKVSPGARRTNVTLLLDEESTDLLRFQRPEAIPDDVKRYEVTGIPATCCDIAGQDS
ncbi:hypothetical protein [Streptomyces smyrnaeus]|uniref:hypothetical protein n=1 Tax=Streptomyces smyrnaeus TaxID=1387713 RepID=UPI000C18C086